MEDLDQKNKVIDIFYRSSFSPTPQIHILGALNFKIFKLSLICRRSCVETTYNTGYEY